MGLVSRDYDYSTGSLTFGPLAPGQLHPTSRPYLIELHPDRGYASLAMVSYDLLSGVLDGINSEGLTVALAMDEEVFAKNPIEPNFGAVGLGSLQTLRLLLDTCGTVDEAKQALLQTKQYYEHVPVHYLIADRFGKSFVWEYSQSHNKEFIIENPDRPLVLTNFTLNTRLDKTRPPSAIQTSSVCKRYCLLTDQLAGPGQLSEEFIKKTHKQVDAELPPDSSRPPVRTFWHALYYPESRSVQISYYLRDEPAPGQPGQKKIVRSDYREFRLPHTNFGAAPAETAAVAEPSAVAEPVDEDLQKAIAELKRGGATFKTVGGRVLNVDLSKAETIERLLPLLRRLPDLEELQIQNPKLDDAGLSALAGLPKLARLGLRSAAVGDDGLKVLKTLPNLRVLVVGGTTMTDSGLLHLKDLTQLDQLGLRGNPITNDGLAHLVRLTNLTRLDLSETKLTDAGLVHLKDMTKLEILMLTGDNITDAGLAHLAKRTTITGLFLGSTKVSDAGLVHLKGMTRLTKLNLTKTAVTEEGVAKARKFLPSWLTIQRDL